jgi:hypothetical protein
MYQTPCLQSVANLYGKRLSAILQSSSIFENKNPGTAELPHLLAIRGRQ